MWIHRWGQVSELDDFAGQTRVETVAWIDVGAIRDMKMKNIHTIEQLAGMSDEAITRSDMIGLVALRTKAKAHIADHRKSSEYDDMKAQNETLSQQMVQMQEQMAQMQEQMTAQPEGQSKRGPGRPRKAE